MRRVKHLPLSAALLVLSFVLPGTRVSAASWQEIRQEAEEMRESS